MTDQELEILRQEITSETPGNTGFGLWNIVKRIHLFYGEKYSLTIDSELGEYTRVSIRIPYDAGREITNV